MVTLWKMCYFIVIRLLKVSWLYEMQRSNQIWGHSEYGSDLFFELKFVSPFNSVESWLVQQPYYLLKIGIQNIFRISIIKVKASHCCSTMGVGVTFHRPSSILSWDYNTLGAPMWDMQGKENALEASVLNINILRIK